MRRNRLGAAPSRSRGWASAADRGAGGCLGPRDPLLRYLAALRHRPVRAPDRQPAAPQAASGVHAGPSRGGRHHGRHAVGRGGAAQRRSVRDGHRGEGMGRPARRGPSRPARAGSRAAGLGPQAGANPGRSRWLMAPAIVTGGFIARSLLVPSLVVLFGRTGSWPARPCTEGAPARPESPAREQPTGPLRAPGPGSSAT
jgi:hypothetical protein